jgi:predicted nucleic acid-binding protein
MEAQFLDTNVIIRYLTRDDPDQAERARHVLREIEAGVAMVTTCEGVIIEAVHILSSKQLYNLARPAIRTHLGNILTLRGLRLQHKRTYLRALDLYASTNLDFVDTLNIAHMERSKITTIISFDRDFDRFEQITRREP